MTIAASLPKLATPTSPPAASPSPAVVPALTPAPSLAAAPLRPALTPAPGRIGTLTPVPGRTPVPGLGPSDPLVPAGKVKGTLVIARMKYLRARGDEDSDRVLRRMPAADQTVLRGMLLPSSWYAADLVMRLEMTIVALLARGDRRELLLDMGRFTADTNLGTNGVQRPYLKEGDPHYLLRNVPRMYAAQHAGGVRTYEQLEPKAAVIRTTAGEEPNAEDCLTAVGWLKRAIELSGGRIVTVEERSCRAFGAAACEYVCRWG